MHLDTYTGFAIYIATHPIIKTNNLLCDLVRSCNVLTGYNFVIDYVKSFNVHSYTIKHLS